MSAKKSNHNPSLSDFTKIFDDFDSDEDYPKDPDIPKTNPKEINNGFDT
jgi:hypothetical protein